MGHLQLNAGFKSDSERNSEEDIESVNLKSLNNITQVKDIYKRDLITINSMKFVGHWYKLDAINDFLNIN